MGMKHCMKSCVCSVRQYIYDIFIPKSLEDLCADAKEDSMHQSLNWFDLTLLGIGAIIGSGIFVLTGQAAGENAGPAIVISYLIAGFCAGLGALCYAEMATMLPVAGSAYSYCYASMGEFLAWLTGWNLILEYMVGGAAVAVGWSGYVVSFIQDVGAGSILHEEWTSAPFAFNMSMGGFYLTGAYINVPAIAISLGLMAVLIVGIKESAMLNNVAVVVKTGIILLFCFATIGYINLDNWTPFIPPEQSWGHYGWSGILQATTIVFFSYIGFDAVSTTGQECRRPQRDLPIGILASLVICTVLYVAVCLCLTGIIPYPLLIGEASPVAKAAEYIGQYWLAIVTEIGAIFGLTTALLVSMLGQPRIFFSMARDGLFPKWAAYAHPRFGTPVVTTAITGVGVAVLGGLLPIDVLSELTSIGTLCAFVLVSIGVFILRLTRPDAERKFKVPFGPFLIPLLSAACSIALIAFSTVSSLIRLILWMALGAIIYVAYGKRHSKYQKRLAAERKHKQQLGHWSKPDSACATPVVLTKHVHDIDNYYDKNHGF